MASVAIDGEKVAFEGDPPSTCGEACELIAGFLSGQGLMIASVSVDGEELSVDAAALRGEYAALDFCSVSPRAQLLAMCKAWQGGCEGLSKEMDSAGSLVLRRAWSESQADVVTLLEKVRPLVEGLGVLQNFGNESSAVWQQSVGASFAAGLASIDVTVDAVQSGDCVVLSDCLAGDMAESWGGISEVLARQVIPVLEAEVGS